VTPSEDGVSATPSKHPGDKHDRPAALAERTGALPARVARHYMLDLVRGLAALAVANYHFLHYAMDVTVQSMGTFTVYLFFAISALTMMMVYGGRFEIAAERAAVIAFYRARAARILPLLIVVGLISAALDHSAPSLARAVLTGSGAFALGPPGYLAVGNGSWSLGIELGFYLVFPLLAMTIGTWSRTRLAVLIVIALVAQQAYLQMVAPWLASDPARHWDYYTSPLTFVPFFLIGFAVYRSADRTRMWWIVPALAMLAALAGASLVRPGNLMADPLAYLALTTITGLVLLFAWRAQLPKLAEPVARFFGEISYSLYLTHWYAFLVARKIGARAGLSTGGFWLVFIVLALAGAWLCYRLFERPLRRRLGIRRPPGG
jgi:peptidoglycan/LPS O-acetylase OafA/YrhL